MSLYKPRCMVCGVPLGKVPYGEDIRDAVCSKECYDIYTDEEGGDGE